MQATSHVVGVLIDFDCKRIMGLGYAQEYTCTSLTMSIKPLKCALGEENHPC